jgi:cytosine/creatinine deaminase
MDLLIKNARLRKQGGTSDIAVSGGKIEKIAPGITGPAETEIDAAGNLVTESFLNAHLHLCKVYTLMMMSEDALKDYHDEGMGKAMTAIEAAAKVKENYDEKWILPNARKAVKLAALNGTTHIRALADVDSKAKLEGIKALLKAREEFKGIVELQVVAFPQDGVVREPEAAGLVREALEMGADVVGGIPWIEFTEADEQEHIDRMVDLAVEFDRNVSMLVDDAGDPGLRTLEMLACKTIDKGWEGRVLAHHARAMCLYPDPYFMKLVALLKRARLGVVSDPHTGPLHARVKDLLAEGALVCLGQDDVSDAYYPYGRNSMLEVAFLNSHLLWMTTTSDMETLYDMITVSAARAMGVDDFGLEVGRTANLVVLQDESIVEAFRNHREVKYLVSHGRLVDLDALRD